MQRYCFRQLWRLMLMLSLAAAATSVRGEGLEEALQATLRNHPAVAGQLAMVDARRYAADGARSQRFPTLSAQAQQYGDGGPSGSTGEDLDQPLLLRVRQPIWSFGRINSTIAAANAEVSTERADLLVLRRQLLEATAIAYAEVRGSASKMEIARQNVAKHKALLEQIQRRVAGQLASTADARLAATRLAQARAARERAISEWEIAREELAELTQVSMNASEPVPTQLLESRTSDELISEAMEYSAELRLKREQLGQAEAEVDEARTSYMPTIYLQADRFYDQPGVQDDGQISLVLEASLDGLGFAARGRTGEAVASRLAAAQDLDTARLELRRELKRLQRNQRLQADLVELQLQSLGELESLFASYERQYESGTKSWLDVLNIQRELFEQRHQLVQARVDRAVYSLQLHARTGGLDSLAGIEILDDG